MSYAINYIGHYLLPPDWVNHPQQATCSSGKRDADLDKEPNKRSAGDFWLQATCDANNDMEITIHLEGNSVPAVSWVCTVCILYIFCILFFAISCVKCILV